VVVGQCIGLLSNGCGWLRDRWEKTSLFFIFFILRKVKRLKLEGGDIDPFFNIILLCG